MRNERTWKFLIARSSEVNSLQSSILAISGYLIIILKLTFLNRKFLKAPSSHCYQSTLVTVSFIGQMFYLSQSEFRFHIITVASNFGIGKTISFAENIASLLISMWFSTSTPSIFSQWMYTFYKTHRTEPNTRNLLKNGEKSSLLTPHRSFYHKYPLCF